MIDFSLSEEQKIMQDTVAKFIKNDIIDHAHDMDENNNIPRELIQKAWELGISVSMVPEDFGGYGMEYSPIMNALVLEELASGDMAYAIAACLPSLFLFPLTLMGTKKQKEKYLQLYCGESYVPATCALCEPHFGFDPVSLKTAAIKKKSTYILEGKKCFVPLAEESSHLLIAASYDNKNELFIVSRDNPGLSIVEREKNIGIYALPTYEISLDKCEIPEDDRLGGKDGCDFDKYLQSTRIALSAIGTGVSRASYEYAREYANERVQFGEPISYRQSIAFMIAEMAYEVDSMRLLTWKAASALEAGKDARRESYLAKIYAGDLAMKITDYGVQILGGHGFVRDHPVERYYRNGRGIAILEGMAIV